MTMLAKQKRAIAEGCLNHAIDGDYQTASRLRQQAYSSDPPGTIGVDWNCWDEIWEMDSRYLLFLYNEDFSDADNSPRKIEALKAGIFIDYLFGFRDAWGVKKQSMLVDEEFCSRTLESFLRANDWDFKCENRELIYAQTKKMNISAKMYYAAIKDSGLNDSIHPHIYENGEYYLGFAPNASQKIIESRREWLKAYDEFMSMSTAGIAKFPKSFQTFQKHKLADDENYKMWFAEYKSKK